MEVFPFLEFEPTEGHTARQVFAAVGIIPVFLSETDPRPAREQFAERYIGGWMPIEGFAFHPDTLTLTYPGDPPMYAIAKATLREETILVFPHAWVLILQPNGTWEVSRMD